MIDRKFNRIFKISRQVWLISLLSLLLLWIAWALPRPVETTSPQLPRVANYYSSGNALWANDLTPEKIIK